MSEQRLWVLSAALAIGGFAALTWIAYGRLGYFEIEREFGDDNRGGASVHLCALMAFFGAWVAGAQKTNLRLAICLCVAALLFTLRFTFELFHWLELLPLAGYAAALARSVVLLRRQVAARHPQAPRGPWEP